MKEIEVDGGNAAKVQDAAVDEVRLPFELQPLYADDGEHAITLEEYRRQERAPFLPPPGGVPTFPPSDDEHPHDSYTVDAEILVDRWAVADFTVEALEHLLDLAPGGVRKRMQSGRLPEPRWPGSGTGEHHEAHRWTRSQVIEIVADRRRRADAYTTDELASLLGVGRTTVRDRLQAGKIPEPRYRSTGPNDSHRWTFEQVNEIVGVYQGSA